MTCTPVVVIAAQLFSCIHVAVFCVYINIHLQVVYVRKCHLLTLAYYLTVTSDMHMYHIFTQSLASRLMWWPHPLPLPL